MILIIAAMEKEVEEIKKHLKPNTILCITGIGKTNAAASLATYLTKYSIEKIYNFGFAGGSKRFKIGETVLIKDATYHDFDLTFFGYEKGQVPGYPTIFESDLKLMEQVIKEIPQIKTERLYTGDYFMTENQSLDFVCDMEGAALYQVAYQFKVPIVSIKVISDIVGMDNHYQAYKKFEQNDGSKALLELYLKII